MIPLKTNLIILTWPTESSSSTYKRKRIIRCILSVIVILTHIFSTAAGAFFIHKFISINSEDSIVAVTNTIPFSNMLYQSILIILSRDKFIAMFVSLSKIYEESKQKILLFFIEIFKFQLNSNLLDKNEGTYWILLDTNSKCEWIWLTLVKYFLIAVLLMGILMPIISVAFFYNVHGHFDPNYAFHILKVV